MAHCVVPEAEALLDKEIPVHKKGFVRLVDYMGGDARIVQAARVSYGEGTKTVREDAGLIDYLLRNEHTSPFEQVILTFHIKMPVFVARQWIRHRTARVNEISGRYSVMKDEFWLPEPEVVCHQSSDNKQGRENEAVSAAEAAEVIATLAAGQKAAYTEYRKLVDSGIARELARVNLPLSLYTEWYWQMDLHNLFRFLVLRTDAHAQREIRDYANVIFDITRAVAPLACASLEQHLLGGARLSADEAAAVSRLLAGQPAGLETRQFERLQEKLQPRPVGGA
ncbi:MAG: FAD-dependent thymidylate synthase [Spirochaetes bacterium]|nr:FAD-dependent thymidylate synthase [Spirochaetota bacterium]MBU0954804.1 FAD-dependent thymidylate synthase [Spirochaetota bacterium]